MLALIALSETYSKYTTAQKGTGTAVIARWEINFKNGATDLSDNFYIDLASTMTSKDKANNFIQPGSKGSFKITVANKSQVPATVDAADTTIGQSSNGAANTICGITLSAVQVDPNA